MKTRQWNFVWATLLAVGMVVSSLSIGFATPPNGKGNNNNNGQARVNPDSNGSKKCPADNGKAQHSPTKAQGNACGQFGNDGQPLGDESK